MENVGMIYGQSVLLRSLGVFHGNLVNFVVIWYKFSQFGMLHEAKSGNSVCDQKSVAKSS
jgi:hypothetical protein